MKRYEAPWSKLLIGLSTFLTLLCLGIGASWTLQGHGALRFLGWIPLVLAAGCALFTVRGYSLTPDA